MRTEAHQHYDKLIESGELKEIFPATKGNWVEDRSKFTKLYNENIKFVLDYEASQEILELDIEYDEFSDPIY